MERSKGRRKNNERGRSIPKEMVGAAVPARRRSWMTNWFEGEPRRARMRFGSKGLQNRTSQRVEGRKEWKGGTHRG